MLFILSQLGVNVKLFVVWIINIFYSISHQSELDKYFKVMDKIVQERQTVTRVRFLMMDVIDLRQNSWVPRREDNKPKTKAQVQEAS